MAARECRVLWRRGPAAALGLVCVLYWIVLAQYFPPASWTSSEPFYNNSYAFHFARGLQVARTLRLHLRVWSYSPSLMAGYPAGTRTEPVGDMAGIWLALTPYLRPAVAYKILVLALLAGAPLAMAATASWLGLGAPVCVAAAALGAAGVFTFPGIAMIRAGMFAFLSACYLCVALGALMYRCVEHGGWSGFAVLAVVGGVLTYLHPLTALLLMPAGAGALIMATENPTRLAWLLASFMAIVVIATGWLGPLVLTYDLGVHFANWWQSPTTFSTLLEEMLSVRLGMPPLIILGVALWGATRARLQWGFKLGLTAGVVAFAILGYCGSMTQGLDNIEPGRFEAAFYFCAAPLVAVAAVSLWERGSSLGAKRVWRAVVVAGGLCWTATALNMARLDLRAHGPICARLPKAAQELTHWIEVSAPGSRLIVEGGWSMKDSQLLLPYFGADLGALWMAQSGRELIGASPSEGFTRFSFVDFGHEMAFGRPLAEWRAEDFGEQLETYNVGGALVWSGGAKRLFSSFAKARVAAQTEGFVLYEIQTPRSFLAEGRAQQVRAQADCIQIVGAQPGRLILRYHYFKTLRCWPSLPIRPIRASNDDPIPFIEILNDSLRDIEVYNAGFLGRDRPACN